PDVSLLSDWLSPAESARLDRLALIDSDDVPSARLALLLGAYYLTNDKPARAAVYGDHGPAAYRDWLAVLHAGSDAGQLGAMFETVVLGIIGIGGGLVQGTRWVAQTLGPWSILPIGIAAAVLLRG